MKLTPDKAVRVREAQDHLAALLKEREYRKTNGGTDRHPVDKRIPDELTRFIFDLGQYRLHETESIERYRQCIEQAQENERELVELLRGLQQEYNIACNTDAFLSTAAPWSPPAAPPVPLPPGYPLPPQQAPR